jgi:hypothetical protein
MTHNFEVLLLKDAGVGYLKLLSAYRASNEGCNYGTLGPSI